jgi:hypothetical protein
MPLRLARRELAISRTLASREGNLRVLRLRICLRITLSLFRVSLINLGLQSRRLYILVPRCVKVI